MLAGPVKAFTTVAPGVMPAGAPPDGSKLSGITVSVPPVIERVTAEADPNATAAEAPATKSVFKKFISFPLPH